MYRFTFPLDFYSFLAADFFESQIHTDVSRGKDTLLLTLTLGCLIIAYIFSSIYEEWNKDYYGIPSGVRSSGLIGLFFGTGIGLVMYGTELQSSSKGQFIDAVFWVVSYAITGIVASIVH